MDKTTQGLPIGVSFDGGDVMIVLRWGQPGETQKEETKTNSARQKLSAAKRKVREIIVSFRSLPYNALLLAVVMIVIVLGSRVLMARQRRRVRSECKLVQTQA